MRLAPSTRRWLAAAAFVYIACHFLWFAFDGTRVGWTEDDPMNLYLYWKPGAAKAIGSNFAFWNGFYRPLGAVFYLPIYSFARMNPAPYRWAMFLLVGLNAALVYRLARRALASSTRAAGFASLFACVHGGMADLVYNTSSIYDVLSVTFSLLALIVYTEGRTGGPAGLWRGLGALALMVLAIDGKEIGATLPAFFLLYEIFFHPPEQRVRWPDWLPRHASWSLAALALAALAMYGKMHGTDSMTLNEQYHPIFSFARWLDANAAYTGVMFYHYDMAHRTAIAVWIAMAAAAWLSKNRTMAWAVGYILLVTIPISFIPKRLGGSLYLPLIGWAIFFGTLFNWLISLLPRRLYLEAAATVAIAVAFSRWTAYGFSGKGEALRATKATTNRVVEQLERLHYQPPHGKHILFLGSPFQGMYDLVFISNLVWNDRTLEIDDANMTPDHGADRSAYDVVIAFRDGGGLEVVKWPPESPAPATPR